MFKVLGYKFSFYHERDPRNSKPHQAYTVCNVHEAASGFFVARGYAFCGKGDQFNKERGRKIALTRALENLKFSKVGRTLAWKAYFERKKA